MLQGTFALRLSLFREVYVNSVQVPRVTCYPPSNRPLPSCYGFPDADASPCECARPGADLGGRHGIVAASRGRTGKCSKTACVILTFILCLCACLLDCHVCAVFADVLLCSTSIPSNVYSWSRRLYVVLIRVYLG